MGATSTRSRSTLFGNLYRLLRCHDSELLVVVVDNANLRRARIRWFTLMFLSMV